jgi:thiamine-phosphate pyrophosphorylase
VTRLATPIICLVTDRQRLCPDARTTTAEVAALERWIGAAIEAGVSMVHLREPDLDASALCALAERVGVRARESGTALVVNDRVDVAIAAGAVGVHLKADAPAAGRIRPLLPEGSLVGRSVHDEAGAADATADYLFFGTVHRTGSKPAGHPVAGLAGLSAAVAAARSTPVVAIGGVTVDGAAGCAAAGAAGVAGIGIFLPPARGDESRTLVDTVGRLRAAFATRGTAGPSDCVV